MLTTEIVIKVFESFGDKFVQPGALIARLREQGFSDADASKAVDNAIGDAQLSWTEMRSLYRP